MNKREITFYFSGDPDTICDYMLQLAREFTKKDLVYGFLLYSSPYSIWRDTWIRSEKPWVKKEGAYMIRQINLLPFQRFVVIRELNRLLHVWVSFPILTWWIKRTKEKVVTAGKPLFIFYHPEKEAGFFRFVYWFFSLTHATLFDVVDYPPVHRVKNALTIYEEYIKKADVVAVNSHTLHKIFSRIRKDIHIVPLGFTLEEFQLLQKTPFFSIDKPIIGFVGALGSRLDYRLLYPLISKNSQWRFVFWGPTQIVEGENKAVIKKNVKRLLSYPNVIHGESVDKREVAGIIQQFAICIIPYDINQDQNRYCFPMKLLEYFYMGKPVVSTPIEELKRFPKYVKIGSTVEGWEEHIKNLLSRPWSREYKEAQNCLAVGNSWERKASTVISILSQRVKS